MVLIFVFKKRQKTKDGATILEFKSFCFFRSKDGASLLGNSFLASSKNKNLTIDLLYQNQTVLPN